MRYWRRDCRVLVWPFGPPPPCHSAIGLMAFSPPIVPLARLALRDGSKSPQGGGRRRDRTQSLFQSLRRHCERHRRAAIHKRDAYNPVPLSFAPLGRRWREAPDEGLPITHGQSPPLPQGARGLRGTPYSQTLVVRQAHHEGLGATVSFPRRRESSSGQSCPHKASSHRRRGALDPRRAGMTMSGR